MKIENSVKNCKMNSMKLSEGMWRSSRILKFYKPKTQNFKKFANILKFLYLNILEL